MENLFFLIVLLIYSIVVIGPLSVLIDRMVKKTSLAGNPRDIKLLPDAVYEVLWANKELNLALLRKSGFGDETIVLANELIPFTKNGDRPTEIRIYKGDPSPLSKEAF